MKQRSGRHMITLSFTPKGEVTSMTSSAIASIVGRMSRPRALAVASGGKDVAFRQQLQ